MNHGERRLGGLRAFVLGRIGQSGSVQRLLLVVTGEQSEADGTTRGE
jgi:hypothetical protein